MALKMQSIGCLCRQVGQLTLFWCSAEERQGATQHVTKEMTSALRQKIKLFAKCYGSDIVIQTRHNCFFDVHVHWLRVRVTSQNNLENYILL